MWLKKMYLKLFNFINGKNSNRFYKFMIHCCTVLLFLAPILWLRGLISILTGEGTDIRAIISVFLIFPSIIIAFPFIVKVMISIIENW